MTFVSRSGTMQAPSRPLLFLDFEASSLSLNSWPVEIGYAWFADGGVASRALVIAPRADWALADWSEASARVHGIALEAALAGATADAVSAETDAFAHFEVVSDNAAWEQRWLDRLRDGRPRIEVRPLRAVVRERLHDYAASEVARTLLRDPSPHRAGPDAARLASAWLGATRSFGLAA